MTISELSHEQMEELKQNYLTQHLLKVEDRSPTYTELINAVEIVPDSILFDVYGATEFNDDDFVCTARIPLF